GVAVAIGVVGVAGVLEFPVSWRVREFGVRLAMGAEPWRLLAGVVKQGLIMAAIGVVAGGIGGFVLARVAGAYSTDIRMPDATPVVGSVLVLLAAAGIASALPAARASRVDGMNPPRSH